MTQPKRGAQTRTALIEAAFEEIYRHGFQGASIDRILDRLGVTRGALFHHFPTKLALGYTVVEELIDRGVAAAWIEPLDAAADPVTALADLIEDKARHIPLDELLSGCPLNNLSQEMSPLDDGFRARTRRVFEKWLAAIERVLHRGQAQGRIDEEVDTREAAIAILAIYEGAISLTKNAGDRGPAIAGANAVRRYLDSLGPTRRRTRRK